MMAIIKIGNYGIYVFTDEYDPMGDTLHNWGFKLWCGKFIPCREETWRWTTWDQHARFTWERRRHGEKFDGFILEGPLIQFKT